MNKRLKIVTILSIFILLIIGLASCNNNVVDDTPAPAEYDISSQEDLLAMYDMVGDKYNKTKFNLKANIDLEGVTFKPIGYSYEHAFTGTFDGGGFTISNIKINDTEEKSGAGLFGYIKDASINNLNIANINIDYTATKKLSYTGGLFGYGYGHNFVEDINVEGNISVKNTWEFHTSTTSGLDNEKCDQNIYVGGILGYNMGALDLERASSKVEISILPSLSEMEDNEIPFNYAFVGGAIGYIEGMDGKIDSTIKNITVKADTIATAATHTNVAGLAGYLGNTSLSGALVEVDNIVMKGESGGSRANGAGGLASTFSSNIEKMVVKNMLIDALVCGPTDVLNLGGLIGFADKTKLRYSQAENISMLSGKVAYSGGIVGVLSYLRTMNDSKDADAGLVAQGYSIVEYCSATGGLYAHKDNLDNLVNIAQPNEDADSSYYGAAAMVGKIWGDSKIDNCYADFLSMYGVVAEIKGEEAVDEDGNPVTEKRSDPVIGATNYFAAGCNLAENAEYSKNIAKDKQEMYSSNAKEPSEIADLIASLIEE